MRRSKELWPLTGRPSVAENRKRMGKKWARGYFVASSGDVIDEIMQGYIQNRFPPNCANAFPCKKQFKQAELKPENPAFARENPSAVRVNICYGDETQENRRAQSRVFSALGAHRNVWHI